ncbi:MAG: InlB B-repeat-containing protein [Treponema sp.]|nr:InlB B-repeat-containing protein [Treponema sp.]
MNNKFIFLTRSCAVFLGFAICAMFTGCDLGADDSGSGTPGWPSYTVSYRANGGSGAMESSVHKHGENQRLNANAFSREGYSFSGWARSFNGAAEFHDRQAVANLSQAEGATVQLFAVWKPNTYTIAYNGNGGSGTMPPSQFTYDVQGNLEAVSFSHSEDFLGWAKTAGGNIAFRDKAAILNITAVNDDVIHLYARWGSGTYRVTFDINGGTGSTPSDQTANAGASISLPGESGFSKPGVAFAGWNTKADGTGDSFNAGTQFTPIQDVTLYARWSVVFEVNFNANGGTGTTPPALTVRDGMSIQLPSGGALTKSGFNFSGWNTAADGSGTNYSAGASLAPKANITLFANWLEIGAGNSYRVTFTINNGTGTTPSAQNPAAGSSITLPSDAEFSRPGFAFVGWNTHDDGTGTTYSAGVSFTPTANITLYARWVGNFTVSFNLNGGTGTTPSVQVANSGSSITLPGGTGITKSGGFVFGGWNTRADGGGTNYTAGTQFTPTASVVLFARWVDVNTTVPISSLAAQLSWVQSNAISGGFYIINVITDEEIAPHSLSFTNPTRTNITVTLKGEGGRKNIGLSADGAMFTVASGVTLILGEDITLNGRVGNTNSVVRVNSDGTLVMNDGAIITGNVGSVDGAGVYIGGRGRLTMNGGEISGNTALNSNGGGVYIASGIATMNGGEISSNTASSGGGIYVSSPSGGSSNPSFTMNGGKVSKNTASSDGGGVYLRYEYWTPTFNLNAGEISGNTASRSGGGVYANYGSSGGLYAYPIFNMRGGIIAGNHAGGTTGGGGVYNAGTFRMSGGVIYGIEESPELRNTGTNAVLYRERNDHAQRGIFSGTNFTSLGDLPNSDTTIRVVNGNLQ